MRKLVIISFFLYFPVNYLIAQNLTVSGNAVSDDEVSLITVEKKDKTTLFKNTEDMLTLKSEVDYRAYMQNTMNQGKAPEIPSFNIVSSFRKNIRFGGFYEGYAIINFTPDMFIQPFGFINIYASHNFSKYIPITSIKENFKSLAIEGAAILAIDNSVKFLFSFNRMIQSIVSFAAKNLVIGMIKNEQKSLLEFKYYYYSVSIRF